MTGTAITLMLIAMVVIWGGLAAAIVNLVRSTPRNGTSSGNGGDDV